MEIYVVDTHGLVWFMTLDSRLSRSARKILEQAEEDETQVLIPTIVLAECVYIAQKKRVEVGIEKILQRITEGDGFSIVPFDLTVFQESLQLPENWEMHDRIIAATAQYYKATLITRDSVLSSADDIATTW